LPAVIWGMLDGSAVSMIDAIEAEDSGVCLVLMFKAPARSKRRLAAEIGERAGTAARHLIDCALEDTKAWAGPVCYAPASPADAAYLDSRSEDRASTVLQRGRNLGERINHVNRALRAAGAAEQIFIGIDCPELDARYLKRAAARLADHDVVLGPADDGGVVLMATRRAWPDLAGLAWSSNRLMRELVRVCIDHGLSVHELDARADVDSLDDLIRIRRRLDADLRPARRQLVDWLERSVRPS
jgi:glycosyltransferase A (GT-A) superfamily protein (DUF2064 family)